MCARPDTVPAFWARLYDPFVAAYDPKARNFDVPALALPQGVDAARLAVRRGLKDGLEQQLNGLENSLSARNLGGHYEKAFALISSPEARAAFDIRQETPAVRDSYGQHRLGQSLLVACRLIEAGVRIVMVNDAEEKGDVFRWDTHNASAVPGALRRNLPETDVALSALLADLHDRGLLKSTLVVWMGEMGRTPKDRTGHWTRCYPAVLAGAGIQGGRVYGESDRIGAFPKLGRCSPADIHATIYRAPGIPGDTVITDSARASDPAVCGRPDRGAVLIRRFIVTLRDFEEQNTTGRPSPTPACPPEPSR